MPDQPREQVAAITAAVTGIVADRGFDLEGVRVHPGRDGRRVVLVVDADGALDLDAIADLSDAVSAALDAGEVLGPAPYTLEVTSPGVDRPLAAPRHWRRAQGRKVEVAVRGDGGGDQVFTARVGPLEGGDGAVRLVVPAKGGPQVRVVALDDVVKAVVQIEFSAPDQRELALAGGVASGKAAAADVAAEAGKDDDGQWESDDEELDN